VPLRVIGRGAIAVVPNLLFLALVLVTRSFQQRHQVPEVPSRAELFMIRP
jgi:hypothetical protein